MKVQKYILPLLALAALTSCGGNSSSSAPASSEPTISTPKASSSQSLPAFENFTLSQVHDARVGNTLPSLHKKRVAVKGKVTFAKKVTDDHGVLTIQSGKFAIEVVYIDAFPDVNIGDPVEVKGVFDGLKTGDTETIWISTYRESVPDSSLKVIDEAITVETVTITKEADLIEFNSSQASIDFDVTGNRTSAAFLGKLSADQSEFIIANKLRVAERFSEDPYVAGDKVKYTGVFSYNGDTSAKVIRYFDKAGFSKAN